MRRFLTLLALLAVLDGRAAAAAPVQLLSSDARGVTLQLTVPAVEFRPGGADGRLELVVPGLYAYDIPGRPRLPFASALVALPPGARAVARLLDTGAVEQRRVGLTIGDRPVFRQEGVHGELVPGREPVPAVLDGPWPGSPVEVGEPFTLRRQRMVAVQLRPFQYDEAGQTLRASRTLTVRLDFVGGEHGPSREPTVEDRHWEPVLREGLLNYEQAKDWRAPAHPAARRGLLDSALPGRAASVTAVAAFDEDFPEVRVKIDTTGVYQMSYASLAAKGYPIGVPIPQVSVHRHEFVEGTAPPYVTIELPIEVDDRDANGVFDGSDRIVVFVQGWAERARASWAQRAWGDAEVVYATAVSGAGLRLPTRPGWRSTPGLTPLPSYPWSQRWEKNLTYFLFPPDTLTDQFHWTEIQLYYERPDTIRFETNHLDTTRAVTVSVTWVGRKEFTHFSWAQYHSGNAPFLTVADSLAWFGRGSRTATVTLPGSTLGEGNVNTLRAWGKGANFPPDPSTNASDNVGLNSIDATYWRRYRAIQSRLACNTGDASGEVQVLASGFASNDIRVYDVTDSLAPVRLDLDALHIQPSGGEFTIEFQDSVAAGTPDRYVVFSSAKTVTADKVSVVTRRQLTARGSGDYLLVVPEAFLPAVDSLVTLRQSQGLDVVVAPFESVCDEFNGGRKSSYAIKRLVRHGYENWNAKFVLLVGDGSEDPLNSVGEAGPDWIPAQKINGPVVIQFGYEIIPSDPWYVCMGNCDLSSFTPVLQDLFIGRLPVRSLQQTQDVVSKIKAYETVSQNQTWRNTLLLSADDDYSAETFFGGGGASGPGYCRRPSERVFQSINQTIADVVRNQAGLQQAVLDTFYLGDVLGPVACDPPTDTTCTCRNLANTQQITHASVTPQLISRLNAGRLWWNFQGHANEFVLTHEDLFLNRSFQRDWQLFSNDRMPFLFSAFSCHANAFARYREGSAGGSLGEEMLDLPVHGAIGSWASSGYEILPFSSFSHINVAWARAMFETPPHDPYLGQAGARALLGETIALALMRYVPTVTFNPNEKGIALTYHLLGDPATALSIGEPQAIVTANRVPVTDGQPVRLHTVGDTLRLEADLVSNVALTQLALDLTDASGTQTIPATDYTLTPAFPDTAPGGLGGRRYHLSYGTTLKPDSYRYTFRTRDRYGVRGDFDVVFQFLTQLRLDDQPLADNDPVPPAGNLSLKLLSPKPLAPLTDLTLFVNGAVQPFAAVAVPGDTSGREWVLSWTHAPYPIDKYEVRLGVAGGGDHIHRFRVVVGGGELRVESPVAFPNPFDDDLGTAFSFLLVSGSPVDVQIRVFTSAGRLVYERRERGLAPGYHQLLWNGRDAEGDKLANGVYLYRMLATNGSDKAEHLGRLVKLRKPRRASSS